MLERDLMLKRDLNEPERDLILSEIKWADFVTRNISRFHFVPRSRSLQRSLFQTRSSIVMRSRVEERSRNRMRSLLNRGTKSAHFVSYPFRDFRTWESICKEISSIFLRLFHQLLELHPFHTLLGYFPRYPCEIYTLISRQAVGIFIKC